MKWAAVMLAIVVAGAVAANAIYTFRPQTTATEQVDAVGSASAYLAACRRARAEEG